MISKQENKNYEIDLVDLIAFLYRKKFWLFIYITLLWGMIIASFYLFDPVYKSNVSIYLKSNQETSAGFAQSQVASRLFNVGNSQNVNALMVVLKSNEILRKVYRANEHLFHSEFYSDRYNEKTKVWNDSGKTPSEESVIGRLRKSLSIEEPNTNDLIVISAQTSQPKLSKIILESLITELEKLLVISKKELSKEKAEIIKEQLSVSKKQYLLEATTLYNYFEKRAFNGKSNQPKDDVLEEIKDILPDVSDKILLEYLTARKNVLNAINRSLEETYHLSKIQIESSYIDFRVIDYPYAALSPSFPKMKLFVIVGFILSLILVLGVYIFYYIIKVYKNEYEIRKKSTNYISHEKSTSSKA